MDISIFAVSKILILTGRPLCSFQNWKLSTVWCEPQLWQLENVCRVKERERGILWNPFHLYIICCSTGHISLSKWIIEIWKACMISRRMAYYRKRWKFNIPFTYTLAQSWGGKQKTVRASKFDKGSNMLCFSHTDICFQLRFQVKPPTIKIYQLWCQYIWTLQSSWALWHNNLISDPIGSFCLRQ